VGLRLFYALLARNCVHCIAFTAFRRARGVHSKVKDFWRQFHQEPAILGDGTEAHKTALMCVNAVESKYQMLNKCKLLFDLVVQWQQHFKPFIAH
jgi:hypothetical protein